MCRRCRSFDFISISRDVKIVQPDEGPVFMIDEIIPAFGFRHEVNHKFVQVGLVKVSQC